MDNLLQVFAYEGGRQVRSFVKDGEPWFVAKDIAEALGYAWDSNLIKHIPEEWKGANPFRTPGGCQELSVLSEQGLYFFLARSDKPKALPFQKWIAGEVVPSIRKTGSYSLQKQLPTHLETAKALVVALEKIEEDKPKVEFYNDVADASGLHDMKETAKLLGWGPNLLFAHLRHMRIFMEKPKNVPRQTYINQGYFEVKERTFIISSTQQCYAQTFVTPKGLQWLKKILPEPKQLGFGGHRPGGGKAINRLYHEYEDRAEKLGGLK